MRGSHGMSLPPSIIPELRDDRFLVAGLAGFGEGPADCMVQRLMGEHVDEDLAPRNRGRKSPQLPQMDDTRASVLPGIQVEGTERDGEAKEPFSFGPRGGPEFRAWHVGLA